MNDTIEANKSEAIRLYGSADDYGKGILEKLFGKEMFTPKDYYEDAKKVYAEFCKENKLNPDDLAYPNPVTDKQKNTNAFEMIKNIKEIENGGKKPDALDTNQYKYYPYFIKNASGSGLSYHVYDRWNSFSDVPARLCLRNSHTAKYAGKNPAFAEVYKNVQLYFKD